MFYAFVPNKTFGSLLEISSTNHVFLKTFISEFQEINIWFIYYTWKNIKSSYNNNKFKISAPMWNKEFELPNGSYSISDIQDYFEHI